MKTPSSTLTALAVTITLGAASALMCSQASAARTRLPLPFSPIGQTDRENGLAVDQSTGNVYALTTINPRGGPSEVAVFGPEGGAPVDGVPSTFGSGSPEVLEMHGDFSFLAVDNACYLQKLSEPRCAEVDPSNGDVYVPYGPGGVVDKYRLNAPKKEYEYVCQFTGFTATGGGECLKDISGRERQEAIEFAFSSDATVDRDGDVYITDGQRIYEFGPTGEPIQIITSALGPEPVTLAVDAGGDIYLGGWYNGGPVVELKRSSFTGPVESEVELATGVAEVVAFDQATGTLITDSNGVSTLGEYGLGGALELEFTAPGENHKGIAVNESSDHVYVSGRPPYTGRADIYAFGSPLHTLDVTTEGATNVQVASAAVAGAVDPEKQEGTMRFEYGTSPSLGSSVAASPSHVSGESSIPVSAELLRLEPHLTYYYRLAGTDSDSTFYGGIESFTTLAIEPTVDVQSPLFVSQHEATLLAGVNAENSDTHYHFLFGTTPSYGMSVSAEEVDLGSSFGVRPVALPVAGLAPGTTYHYALVASNSQGTVQSGDETFTTPTLAELVPEVATGAASEVSPNGANISGTVDPRGLPTSYEFDIGTDTTYGSRVFGEVGSGTQPSTLTLGLQGLAAGTLYHYRLVATNRYGTVYGADETFTTPAFPTALLASPVGAPLVAAPAFNPPSTSDVVTVGPTSKAKPKAKAKRRAKQKRKTARRGARKATRARRSHSYRRSGR
jgi:hypothetical protein